MSAPTAAWLVIERAVSPALITVSLTGHCQVVVVVAAAVVPTAAVVGSAVVLMEYRGVVQVQQDILCTGHYP